MSPEGLYYKIQYTDSEGNSQQELIPLMSSAAKITSYRSILIRMARDGVSSVKAELLRK